MAEGLNKMSFTGFVEPTFALASHFPEIEPLHLLQLVEAPPVRLAFYEFRSRCWDQFETAPSIHFDIKMVEKALADFRRQPRGTAYQSRVGGGDCSAPDKYRYEDSFYAFMSRIYGWVVQDYLDLPIYPYIEDQSLSASLLWGILGICISVHERGQFPEPPFPLPSEQFKFKHVGGNATKSDLVEWQNGTRALRYEPGSYPLWQEWRIRHKSLKEDVGDYVVRWVTKVADDFSCGRKLMIGFKLLKSQGLTGACKKKVWSTPNTVCFWSETLNTVEVE